MKLFIFLLYLLPTLSVAKAYKCQINGKKVYQMHPCPQNTGGEIDVSNPQPKITDDEIQMRHRSDKEMLRIYRELEQRDQFLKNRMASQEQSALQARRNKDIRRETGIAPGMTQNKVSSVLGKPKVINNGLYDGGKIKKEQWVYYDRDVPNRYVYFENGIMTNQQWTSRKSEKQKKYKNIEKYQYK